MKMVKYTIKRQILNKLTRNPTYKEELTENEVDCFSIAENFYEDSSYKADYTKALKYAKKIGGQVYTMVDGDDNHTHYLKGLHWVNRFGFCVLKK